MKKSTGCTISLVVVALLALFGGFSTGLLKFTPPTAQEIAGKSAEVAANLTVGNAATQVPLQAQRITNPKPTLVIEKPKVTDIFKKIRPAFKIVQVEADIDGVPFKVQIGCDHIFSFLTCDSATVYIFGTVSAITDMSKMSENNIWWTTDNTLYVVLPKSEVYQVNVDPKRTLEKKENGWLKNNDSVAGQLARAGGDEAIKKQAVDSRLLVAADKQAAVNMRKLLTPIISVVPGARIVITIEDDESGAQY